MNRWGDPFHEECGVALVITLLIVTLVAVMVLELNYLMRVEMHSAANFRDEVRAYYVAKSGVTLVGELLHRDLPELAEVKRHLLAGVPQTVPVGADSVTVRVVDEQGKINLNALAAGPATASPAPSQPGAQVGSPVRGRPGAQAAEPPRTWIDITQDLCQRLGLNPMIVGALADWIDIDDLPTGSGGAESQHYRTLEKPYVARNAPMETLAELRLIRGVTDDVLFTLGAKRRAGLVDPATNAYLTVVPLAQGGQWHVNLNTAPLPILASMTREVGDFAHLIIERRSQQWITNMAELQALGITGTALQDFQQYGTLTSSYFSVQVQGTVGELTSQITALIHTPQGQGSPTPTAGVGGSPASPSATGGTPSTPNPQGGVAVNPPSPSLTSGGQGSQVPTGSTRGRQAPAGSPSGSQSQAAGTQGTQILYWRVQ
jgi:general secretion pathway protein K